MQRLGLQRNQAVEAALTAANITSIQQITRMDFKELSLIVKKLAARKITKALDMSKC